METKDDEPLCVVTLLKPAGSIEERSITLASADAAKDVSDWLSRNYIPFTRLSKRAYEALIAAREARAMQIGRPSRSIIPRLADLSEERKEAVAWCPFCNKEHAGGGACLGHHP